MASPTLTIHGAAGTVTGSCFEIASGRRRFLVDCGLFQGSRSLEALNRAPFQFDPKQISGVLLTHAHLDHSGLLPRLVAGGFRGTVWCTKPTMDLLAVMLPDAAKIEAQETERRNRRADRADEPPIEPIYEMYHVEKLLGLVRTVELDTEFDPVPGVRAKLWNAGHILGAASIELEVDGVTLLFSGDLGPEHKSFHLDPTGPRGIDHVICESTYGDRDREQVTIEDRRTLLAAEVKRAIAKGGNLIIPVFALERTQELLLDLATLMNRGRLERTTVFIDSPLASRATEVFQRYRHELEDVGDAEVFRHPSFHFVESVEASMHLKTMSGAIILAASGMCEGGRIRYHLMDNLPRSDSTLLFVGYQAQGTLGRAILEGARRVRISGHDAVVRAEIRRLDSYSAHADRRELINWIEARRPMHGSLFLVHGEPSATSSLKSALEGSLASVLEPEIGERYALPAGAPAHRLETGRLDLRHALGRDWQNDYADFAVNLKRDLQKIRDAEQRRKAVERMRAVLEEFGG
ncbi:MAG TPA: MBL fold metallo-hydrolase [Sphingomicrobium sp.]|nr:MBL fold metallo-hydrolase [Sphingomicrobium sp.]